MVVLCVMPPAVIEGVPTDISLMLLTENDEAAPVALMFAELPTPLSRPAEIVPVLVIGPVLAVVCPMVPTTLATPSLVLLETEDRTHAAGRADRNAGAIARDGAGGDGAAGVGDAGRVVVSRRLGDVADRRGTDAG